MNAWMSFWGILLLVTLVLYTVLVVYVTIGGFVDIKKMIKKLSSDRDADDES